MNVNGIEIEDPVFSAFAAKVKNAPYQSDVEWLRGMSKKDREQMLDVMESRGLIAPRDRGFFGEAGKGFNRAFIGGLRGIGATMNELGLGSGMQDYFDEVMRTNQQWNAPENPSTAGWLGGALGNGAGSMAVLAPALVTDALTTKMPIATSAAVFGQSFGENLQRNRAAYGPENEGKSVGLAAAESAVDTAIELALGTVPLVGKAMKGLGRGGKRELVKAMYREAEKDLGRSGAKRFFIEMGKNSGEEGLEEALQYTNTWMWRAIGGDKDNKFELIEVLDAAGQGAIGAIPFGAFDGM